MADDALTAATKLLGGRDKSSGQLRAALEKKGYPPREIDEAVRRVVELGYLDDARLLARLVADGLEDGWVGEALVARLTGKGFPEATVREVLAGADFDARARAKALLGKRRLEGAKAARFLASRGFDEDLVASLVGSDDLGG